MAKVKNGSVLIQVLAGDLKMGVTGDAMGCALGRAFNRDLVGACKVLVERKQIRVFWGSSKGWRDYLLTEKLIEYNRAFDLGDPLKPMDFGFDPKSGEFSEPLVDEPTKPARRSDSAYDPTPAGQGVG